MAEEKQVNFHGAGESGNNWAGLIAAVLVILALFFLVVYFILPAVRNAGSGSSINVDVPDQINVQTPSGGNTGGAPTGGQ